MQSTEGSRDSSFRATKGMGPSPALSFHHFLRALTLAMHSWHSSTGPVPGQGSLGLERTMLSGAGRRTSFMENAPFHIPNHTNPKDQPGCTVGASRAVLCSLVWGWGGFVMHHFLLFPNTKNSNWPLFYRMAALSWPLNPSPCALSIPKLVFWVGWPRAEPLMAGEMVAVVSH